MSKLDKNNIDGSKIKPEEFEKDHDDNGHIDFIHASSNLRARNYDILECDRPTTKKIAGKIIPTIMTTTATVSGFVSLQLFTLLQTHDIKYLRYILFNLNDNYFLFRKPAPAIKIKDKLPGKEGGPSKAIPEGWTIWDKIEIRGSKTMQAFYNYLNENYNITTIDMVIANGKNIIYDQDDFNEKRNRTIEDLFLENDGVITNDCNKLIIQIIASIAKTTIGGQELENVSVDMPPIKYIFRV